MLIHLDTAVVTNQRGKESRSRLVLFSLIAAGLLSGARLRAATVTISPGADIPSVVSANPAGTTFIIKAGLYRLQTPINAKNGDVFSGQSGATLSGSRLLTSFKTSGSYYYVDGQTQQGQVTIPSKHCNPGYPGCIYPEDLFFDGVPLVHVTALSEVGPGKWYFDYAANVIYFSNDPAGHTVETSVTPSAFSWGPANNVTIEGLTIEEFATPISWGALGGNTGPGSTTWGANWAVQNNTIKLNHGSGIRVNFGWQILNNHLNDNGDLGISGGLGNSTVPSRILIQGNEVAYNNYAQVKDVFGGGGIKILDTLDLVIRGNNVHDNLGDGIHMDTNNYNTLYDNNTVTNNTQAGIFHEISYAATIRNNKVSGNGYIYPDGSFWLYGANLLSSESQDVDAYCNTVQISSQGGNGTDIIAQDRTPYGPSKGNYFHHNTVTFDGNSGVSGASRDDATTDPNFYSLNHFDYNTYHLPSLSRAAFPWGGGSVTFAKFQAGGQDTHGSADTKYTASVPTVAITSPGDQSTVSGDVDVSGTAQGDLSKIEFYVDWVLKETGAGASPFGFTWNTSGVAAGSHTVAAMAYNIEGIRACYAVTLNVP